LNFATNCNFLRYTVEISALEYTEAVSAGRRIHQLVSALEDVEQFHQVDVNLQTKVRRCRLTLSNPR